VLDLGPGGAFIANAEESGLIVPIGEGGARPVGKQDGLEQAFV